MTNPFDLRKEERRREWQKFRNNELSKNLSDKDHLQMVVDWWSKAPLSSRSIDPYDPDTWPSGWELVMNGDICEFSMALGMEQTLLLRDGRWTPERVQLWLISDEENIKLVVVIDNKWFLNYFHGILFDCSKADNVSIIQRYKFFENKHVLIE